MTKITPKEWKSLLEQAVYSHQPDKGKKGGHEYIVAQDGTFSSKTLQSKEAPRLSIQEITEISKNAFTELTKELTTPITQKKAHEYRQLVKDIHDLTKKLIGFREEKRNRFGVNFLRTVAHVISALASLILIGIPFFLLIRNHNIKFWQDISAMKEAVLEAGKASQRNIDQQKIVADITLLKKYSFEEKEIDSILSLKEGITPLMDQYHLLDSKPSLTRNEKDELELSFPRKLRELKLLIDHDVDTSLAQKLIEMKGDFPLKIKMLTVLNEKFTNEKDEKLKKGFEEQIGNLVKEIKIKFQLTRIPEIVKQVKEMTDATRQEIIQEHFIKEVSAKPNSGGNLFSFVGDFERSEAFERKDEKLNIDDKVPQPPYHKNRESKGLTKEQLLIQQTEMDEERAARPVIGAALLDELLKYEEGSLIWKPILQTAVGQFNHYRVHGDFIGKFNIDSIEQNNIFDLKVQFTGGEHPPIKLEIIRDPQSNKISRINIEVEGSFDVVSSIIKIDEAVFGSLKYSIALDSNKKPVISDVISKIEIRPNLSQYVL